MAKKSKSKATLYLSIAVTLSILTATYVALRPRLLNAVPIGINEVSSQATQLPTDYDFRPAAEEDLISAQSSSKCNALSANLAQCDKTGGCARAEYLKKKVLKVDCNNDTCNANYKGCSREGGVCKGQYSIAATEYFQYCNEPNLTICAHTTKLLRGSMKYENITVPYNTTSQRLQAWDRKVFPDGKTCSFHYDYNVKCQLETVNGKKMVRAVPVDVSTGSRIEQSCTTN